MKNTEFKTDTDPKYVISKNEGRFSEEQNFSPQICDTLNISNLSNINLEFRFITMSEENVIKFCSFKETLNIFDSSKFKLESWIFMKEYAGRMEFI